MVFINQLPLLRRIRTLRFFSLTSTFKIWYTQWWIIFELIFKKLPTRSLKLISVQGRTLSKLFSNWPWICVYTHFSDRSLSKCRNCPQNVWIDYGCDTWLWTLPCFMNLPPNCEKAHWNMISLSVIGRFLSSVNTPLNAEKIEHDVLVISGIRFKFFKIRRGFRHAF
jgi:hypothetical protein